MVGIDFGFIVIKGILLVDGVIVCCFFCFIFFCFVDVIYEVWEILCVGFMEMFFLIFIGYGCQLVDFVDKQVMEIFCYGFGVCLLVLDICMVIDIGGQDSKVIQLDVGGNFSDFLMNDKCVVGIGCFLEVILCIFGVSVE